MPASSQPGLVDTHCHILPAIDDGPATLDAAIRLSDRLLSQGVSHVVATPHVSSRFRTSPWAACEALSRLQEELATRSLPLTVSLGGELAPATAAMLSSDDFRSWSFGDRRVLVELEPRTRLGVLQGLASRIAAAGLFPVWAHPERCKAIQDSRDASIALSALGTLQVTLVSLKGSFGTSAAETGWRILSTHETAIIASDAHGADRRPPLFDWIADHLTLRLGPEGAERVLHQNAVRIIDTPLPVAEAV